MSQLSAFRKALVACFLVICSIVVIASASPAEARPRHRGHHAHSHSYHHHHHHVRLKRHLRHHSYGRRHSVRRMRSHARARAALMSQDGGFSQSQSFSSSIASSASNVVAEARRYIGGNPTGRRSLWCARFMNMVLQRSGHRTTGSDMARSFASYGQRVSGPQVGAIAVMSRGRRGGHVGIVSGVDSRGNPIVVSGNHGRRVAESVYSRSRIYAYVMPN
jgi:uncharacterized protein (TIGR02594 family)